MTKLSDLPFRALGGQPAFDPADLERFVAAPRVAVLAYTRRDGSPNQVPIWYAYENGSFVMMTSSTSPKAKALARNPRVCMTIQDETPPYRAVIIDGTVTLESAPPSGGTNSRLATRYFGKLGGREYEKMTAEDNAKTGLTRIMLRPERVRGFDNHRLIGIGLRAYMRVRNVAPIPREWI
jgi:PPOX class probable F420-dependent enzyme